MRSTHDTISSASMLYVNSDINTAVVGKNRRVSMASGYDLARAESGRFVGHDTTTTTIASTTTPGSNEEREDGDEGERRRMKKQRGFIMRGLSSEEGSHSEQTIEREHGFDAFGAQGGHSAIPIVSPWRDSPQKIAEWKREAEQSGDSWIGHYSAEFNNCESTIDSSEFDHGIDDGWAAAGYGGMGQPQHEGQAAPSAEAMWKSIVHAQDDCGNTPLHYACERMMSKVIIRMCRGRTTELKQAGVAVPNFKVVAGDYWIANGGSMSTSTWCRHLEIDEANRAIEEARRGKGIDVLGDVTGAIYFFFIR